MSQFSIESVGYPDASVRIAWLDRLKIVAAFAVVMTHIASIPWQVLDVRSSAWLISSVYEILTRFCVPSFFFVTGAVLLNPNKEVSGNRLKLLVLRALFCALGVSALYVFLETTFDGWLGWADFVRRTLAGPYFIWYLWVLLGLYVLIPVLRHIARDEKVLTYSCCVLFVFVVGKSTVISMAPDSLVNVLYGNFILFNRGSEAVFYCLTGAWFISHRLSTRLECAAIVLGALSAVGAIWSNWLITQSSGPDLYYVNRDNVLICLLFFGVAVVFSRWGNSRPIGKIERLLCDCGLMIYLIHPFIRLLFERIPYFSEMNLLLLNNPAAYIPLVSVGCYLISFAFAILLRMATKLY